MKTLFITCALIALMPACLTSYVPCEPCDQKALFMCPPVPTSCQVVKEPGCGCCLTCALLEGQECGVYTAKCAAGLRCLPRLREKKPLQALLHGKGVCLNDKSDKPVRDQNSNILGPVTEDLLHPSNVRFFPQDHINNKKVLAVHKDKKKLQSKLRTMGFFDTSTLSIEKAQQEIGLCREKLDIIVRRMKDMPRVMTMSLYLPNCDKKGFFKRKQCKPSRGRKRGICWCVDKYGAMVPETDSRGGSVQCRDTENSSKNK
ncbi:insulin-like growth factor-binding protein 5a [Silurus meridionalis]|uniref:Insulin-like growth factor-binding protein 5 n=1 Tax=Silurus meridionalis TaxID=175797 RepID=A0A8T0BWG1_SILME|nr:insulin-like growth factor-binding protein 5a [Silurus meridionalis]KAF7711338.1 hypothetical protein HF521_000349 [Silurus meridionalis]KAI5108915.1 insulin-like growth factor binding protein 5a precursor [Silurus meridionalis]